MKLLKGWKIRLLAGLAIATAGGQLDAQGIPGSPDSNAMGPPSSMMYASYPQDATVAPESAVDPNLPMVADPSMGGAYCGPEGMYGPAGCGPECGPGCGCGLFGGPLFGRFRQERCDIFGRSITGFMSNLRGCLSSYRGALRPYGEGGIATQRWFDLSAEAVFLSRTTGAANFDFSSDGINGPRVLTSNMVDMDTVRAGLGLQVNLQTGPGSNVEVVYFGLNRWEESAEVGIVNGPPRYYSFISNFGLLPPGGFDDSDRSFIHRIDYSSEFHNGEVNFRRRWAEPYGFWQGSFLAGIRNVDIDEQGRFTARGNNNDTFASNGPRFFDYTVNVRNCLVGFQVGGDLWYNLLPGVKVGTELKTGIYNNDTSQDTYIFASSLPLLGTPDIRENFQADRASYVTQFNTQLWYRLNYSLAFRTSYQLLCIDNVALATENFNGTPPSLFLPNSARTVGINNSADIVYQGFTFGAEFMW